MQGRLLLRQRNSTGSFSNELKDTQRHNSKFRPTVVNASNDSNSVGNLMYDRRVVRGNTYALHTLPPIPQQNVANIQRQQEARRRALARRKAREVFRLVTPEPVHNRKNIDVQTELYLEELTDRIEEADVYIQTDRFLDRPSTPLYVPQATGRDRATQIEDGELFDFDMEVKPVVETLAGKTTEQALVEVAEEEEIASMRDQHRNYEELRNAELIELQRFEEQERRLRTEKDRRMQQAEDAYQEEQDVAQKIAARAFTRAYLQDLMPSVVNNLRENGYFYDPVERETETAFMPWLMERTMTEVNQLAVGRTILDSSIREAVNQQLNQSARLEDSLRQSSHGSPGRNTPRGNSVKSSERRTERHKTSPEQAKGANRSNSDDGNESGANTLGDWSSRSAMIPSETSVRISIPYLMNFIVSLPFVGMVASFVTSVLFTKEQIFESECGSRNFIPSFSSVIGVSPGKYIWRMAIAMHCFPRFLIASLYHNQFQTSLSKLKYTPGMKYFVLKQLIRLNTFFELCEVFGLILLSYISSKENYGLHEKGFIIFMLSSTLRMITCLILFRQLLYKCWLVHEFDEKNKKFRFQASYQWKMRLFCSAFVFSLLLVVAYIRHTSKCSNNIGQPSTAWSYFSACEYIICCLIMGYHATVCWDFNHFELTIHNKTTAKLHYGSAKAEQESVNEQSEICASR